MWEERSWNVYVYLIEIVLSNTDSDNDNDDNNISDAGDLLGSMWKAGLWQGWKILQPWAPVYASTHNKLLWDFKIPTDN